MLTLIEKGMTREQLTTLFNQRLPNHGDNQVDFKPLLEADPEVTSRLTQEEIDEIFNPVTTLNVLMKSSNASVWVTNLNKITESRFALLFLMVTFMSLFLFDGEIIIIT